MANEMLEKVIRTTEIGAAGGGLLAPEQSARFLDYMFDATVLGDQVRVKRLRADTAEIERIRVGERIVRGATEAVDTGENAGVAFSKISLTTRKLRLDWELSSESLEDNIEGDDLEDHIARLMATQAGNDLEDLAINGREGHTDPLLKQFDGWREEAVNGTAGRPAANVVDAAGATPSLELFNRAIKAMPRKFMQRRQGLRFFAGSNTIQDFIYTFVNGTAGSEYTAAFGTGIVSGGGAVAEGPAGWTTRGMAFGINIQEVPLFNTFMPLNGATGDEVATGDTHGDIWLTYPENLIWAVKRDIEVYREFKPKKDSIEYTVYTRVGTAIENAEAMVVVTNVGSAENV